MGGQIVFSPQGARPDLGPGRFMYDLVHWRSEFRVVTIPVPVEIVRSPFPIGDGRGPARYDRLPTRLASKAEAGDPPPPGRGPDFIFDWTTKDHFVEYLSQPNRIEESHAASDRAHDFALLDTLMVATGRYLPAQGPDPAVDRIVNPVMTYYHGYEKGPVMFSGFDVWSWSRADCARLVDAVLTGVWGLTRTPDPGRPLP